MARTGRRMGAIGILAMGGAMALSSVASAQKKAAPAEEPAASASIHPPDAQRTRQELSELFERFPPAVRHVLAADPTLLGNEAYLQPYPALASFLNEHPEVAHDPSFYIGSPSFPRYSNPSEQIVENMLGGIAVFIGFGMAIGLLIWLVRTLVDFKRWSRLSQVQTEVHTKLMDRFSGNEELLAYIKSPAGAKFLESSPITLDGSPRSVGAPLARILWSVQGGVVLIAAGIGLQFVSAKMPSEASQAMEGLGMLSIALGLGFVISAIISFVISKRLGLIEPPRPAARMEPTGI